MTRSRCAVAPRDHGVVPVERRVVLAGSPTRWCAPRLSSRAARMRAISRASGCGSSSSASRAPSASRTMPASRHSASRVSRDRHRESASAAGASPARRRSAARRAPRSAGAPAEHEALASASSRPAGWRRAGRCRRTRRRRRGPATVERAVEVGDDAAHHVVRGGRDRDRARASGRGPTSRSAATTFGKRAGSTRAHVEADDVRARSSAHLAWIARATSSRGASSSTKRSPSASSSVAPSPRIASVTRKPSRPLDADHRGGVELHRTRGRRARRRRRARAAAPMPDRAAAGSSCAPTAPRRRRSPARRRARAIGARRPRSTTPAQRPSSRPERRARARARAPRCAGRSATSADSWRTTRRPVALPPACTTRRSEWPPSRPSASSPWRSASKRTPSALQVAHAPRRLAAQDARRPTAHEAAAGALGVVAGAARASRRRRARPRSRPGPSSSRSAPAAWRETSTTRAPSRGRGQRGVQPGGAGADDGDVRRAACGAVAGSSRGVPYPAMAARSCFRHPSSLRHDTGRAPRARGADHGDRARARAPRLARLRACASRPGRAARAAAARCIRPSYVDAIAQLCARGRRHARPRHGRQRRARCEAALHAAGGACALVDALLGGRGAGRGFACTARPAITPRPRGRWASACSTTSRSPRGTRSTRYGARARPDPRLGRAPRQRDQRHLPRRSARCCSSRSTSRRCIPGTGAAARRRARARGEGYTVNLPVPRRARATTICVLAGRARGRARWRARSRRSWCSSRRASTRTATTRSPAAR